MFAHVKVTDKGNSSLSFTLFSTFSSVSQWITYHRTYWGCWDLRVCTVWCRLSDYFPFLFYFPIITPRQASRINCPWRRFAFYAESHKYIFKCVKDYARQRILLTSFHASFSDGVLLRFFLINAYWYAHGYITKKLFHNKWRYFISHI